MSDAGGPERLVAYEISAGRDATPPCVAPATRDWMEALPERFAYRCLPLAIANQMGWEIPSPVAFAARWNGGPGEDAIELRFDGARSRFAQSHFGHGVLSFAVGFLFRTPPGHNLWVTGPANRPKDGIAPLEGLVETDWAPFSFTMNWRFTRADHEVRFAAGEPVARILPFPRGYLERFRPEIRALADDPALEQAFGDWRSARAEFLVESRHEGFGAYGQGWQKDYMLGRTPSGERFAAHQTKLTLAEFEPRGD
jgi:hypothetical protein